MSKAKELLEQAAADDSAAKEISRILGQNRLWEANDEQLLKISELAEKQGFDIGADDIKDAALELSDDDIEKVVAGICITPWWLMRDMLYSK